MQPFSGLGRWLILVGLILVVAGVVLSLFGRISWLGNLPGDIRIERDGFSFYFPITTCILLSVVLTLLVWLIGLFR